MNKLEYKGYQAEVIFDAEDCVLYGKVLDINDHIIFEIDVPENAMKIFKEAINNYLQMCEDIGKEPDKSYSGIFNVRIPKSLHKRAVQKARKEDIALNKFVENAIELALDKDSYASVINIFQYSPSHSESDVFYGGLWGETKRVGNVNSWKLQ